MVPAGVVRRGRAWFTELLALPGASAPTPARARGTGMAGHLAGLQGQLDEAEALLDEGIATAQQVGDSNQQAMCWQLLGNVARLRGALPEAGVRYQRAIALALLAGNRGWAAWSACLYAQVQYESGDIDGTRTALAAAVERGAADVDPRVQARLIALRGWLARQANDHVLALELEEQSLALAQAIGDQQGLVMGNLVAARSAIDLHDRPAATRRLAAALRVARDTGEQQALARGLEGVAQVVDNLEHQHTVRLVGAATALRQTHGLGRTPLESSQLEPLLADAQAHLGEQRYATAWAQGLHGALDDSVALALALVASPD